jgi:hypothetical protein
MANRATFHFRSRELKMNLDEFRNSLTATAPPAGLSLALAGLWWDAKGIGRGRTSPRSRTKAWRVRGYTPTCIVRKAIRATRGTEI